MPTAIPADRRLGSAHHGAGREPNIGYDPVGDFSHIAMIAASCTVGAGKPRREIVQGADALSNSKRSRSIAARPERARSASHGRADATAQDRQPQPRALSRRAPLLTDFFATTFRSRRRRSCRSCSRGEAGAIVPCGDLDRAHSGNEGRADRRRDRLSGNERCDLVLAGGAEGLPAPIVAKLNEKSAA